MVPHGRSLCSDATVGRLVGDHFLRVQLLYACGCLRFRWPRRALLASRRACSALASLRVLCPRPSTRATSVWGWRTITHARVPALRRAQRDNAVTRCKNCHARDVALTIGRQRSLISVRNKGCKEGLMRSILRSSPCTLEPTPLDLR